LLVGLGACAQPGLRRAVVDVPDVENAIAAAKLLDSRRDQPIPAGASWFVVSRGTQPAIVTAAHATKPFRDGNYRFADGGGTGGLAVALHAVCDVTVVYTSYDSPSDPNYYDDNEFKSRLAQLITEIKPALLLDIHGSHAYRPYDVDLGTMHGRSLLGDTQLLPALAEAFGRQGMASISTDWFPAAKNQTITKFASARGVPAVQLEFSVTRTSPLIDALAAHRYAQTIESLVDFLGQRGLCARVNGKTTKP
jgi:hypothetical protein